MSETFQILSFLFLPITSFIILIFFGNRLKGYSSTLGISLIGLMLLNSLVLLFKAKPYDKYLGTYEKWSLHNSIEWFSREIFQYI